MICVLLLTWKSNSSDNLTSFDYVAFLIWKDFGMKYPLAPNGIFSTIQGEGIMLGVPMVFVRLAGCSVGCKECDTDYSVSERSKPDEIAERVAEVSGKSDWVWITGGEPTDHDLVPLFAALRRGGFRIAVATAGTRLVPQGSCWDGVDFLSVSPHSVSSWMQKSGSQINIVPGLNGLKLKEIDPDCGSFTM
jgi:organic radical activating enzyme